MNLSTMPRQLLSRSWIALSLLASCAEPIPYQRDYFSQHELLIGPHVQQTLLSSHLLGEPTANLLTVHRDAAGRAQLRVFSFERERWTRSLEAELDSDVRFVDVLELGQREGLITYANGGVSWVDPYSGSGSRLLSVPTNFTPPHVGEVPHVDLTRDLNGDGKSDLLLPDRHGIWVSVQEEAGRFAPAILVRSKAEYERILGADGYRYDPWSVARIHEVDVNLDGRVDLVHWSEDHLAAHLQDEEGRFASQAQRVESSVSLDSDQLGSLATGTMQGRILHSINDLNGDQLGDLLIVSLSGAKPTKKRSSLEVHLGERAPGGGLRFSKRPALSVESPGRVQLECTLLRLGREGGPELMIRSLARAELSSTCYRRFRGMMGGEVYQYLEFYGQAEGLPGDTAAVTRRINLKHPGAHQGPGWVPLDLALRGPTHVQRLSENPYPRAFNSPILVGDVTGDGQAELLVGLDANALSGMEHHPYDAFELHLGRQDAGLLEPRPVRVPVPMPPDGEYVWMVDLNRDGRQDIVLHHTSPTGSQRVITLLAK